MQSFGFFFDSRGVSFYNGKNGEGMVFVDAIQRILSRVSVRRYSDREISDEALRVILEAGMAGPSCVKEHVFLILLPGFFLKRWHPDPHRPGRWLPAGRGSAPCSLPSSVSAYSPGPPLLHIPAGHGFTGAVPDTFKTDAQEGILPVTEDVCLVVHVDHKHLDAIGRGVVPLSGRFRIFVGNMFGNENRFVVVRIKHRNLMLSPGLGDRRVTL